MVVVRSDWFELARGGTEPSVEEEQIFFLYFRLEEILCVSAKQRPSLERKWKNAGEMGGKSHGFLAA